jgi:hypothetical protein
MFEIEWGVIANEALWFLVIAGWITLIVAGLEADKPLSGGIPGHGHFGEEQDESSWTSSDQLGVVASWGLFALAAALLPVILWWIFTRH